MEALEKQLSDKPKELKDTPRPYPVWPYCVLVCGVWCSFLVWWGVNRI